jgi:two-component system phosphate regulon response regulator PhoB
VQTNIFKILVIEDALDVQLQVKAAIGKTYSLTFAGSAHEAKAELARDHFALIVLDIGLPDEDGFSLCASIRSEQTYRDTPIVFLTGKSDSRDKVHAFSLGADDYVVKPFDIPEFRARIESKMRRLISGREEKNTFTKGPFHVALDEQRIYIEANGATEDLGLTPIEFKLLYYFLMHEEHVLTRDQILNHVWGDNTHVTDRTVDTHIYALRKKLGPLSRALKAVPRVGYKLALSKTRQSA